MPIQYRCRCGQEVILRQRESVYLVVALILALTLVNTVFAVLLWNRLGDLEERRVEVGRVETLPAPDPEPEPVVEVVQPEPPVVSEPVEEPRVVEPLTAEAPRVEVVLDPFVEVERPDGFDTLSVLRLLQQVDGDDVRALALRVAAVRWTHGEFQDRALVELRDRGWGALAAPLTSSSESRLRIPVTEHPKHESLLREMASQWQSLWSEWLPVEGESDWFVDAREALTIPADNVVLIDLSESMSGELEEIAAAVTRLSALTGGRQRWGWISYRDDVVDKSELSADFEEFTASIADAWRGEAGGDVPEGLDRALFGGLRFGAFRWDPKARHRFFVIGDAPPPYERIAPMISLVEAAASSPEKHQVHCLAILREEEFRKVPGFDELARVSGGSTVSIDEGESIAAALWRLFTGSERCLWQDRPRDLLR